jgi:hypothetical protein
MKKRKRLIKLLIIKKIKKNKNKNKKISQVRLFTFSMKINKRIRNNVKINNKKRLISNPPKTTVNYLPQSRKNFQDKV